MSSPFPGMNPYLEHPTLWSGIHHRLITAIANDLAPKIRPPQNKQSVVGRLQYKTKRQKILRSDSHLVEIDLLRQGKSMPILETDIHNDYQILVSRSNIRPKAELYHFNLQDKIPQFILPLRSEDTEPIVDLQTLLHEIYDQGGYDLRLDYSRSPVPSLSGKDTVWVDELLKREGLR